MNEEKSNTTKKRRPVRPILIGIALFSFVMFGVVGVTFAMKAQDFRKQLKDGGPLFFMMEKLTEELNLSSEQKTQVDALRKEVKDKMDEKKKSRENAAEEMEKAFRQDKLDASTIETIQTKRENDRKEMKEFFRQEIIKFHEILTPEQRNKVADRMKEMREKCSKCDFRDCDRKRDRNRDRDKFE